MNWPFLMLMAVSVALFEPAVTQKPEMVHLGMAAPDVVVLMIQAQSVEHGKQIPYEKQPGDKIRMYRQHRFVQRGGTGIGALVGTEGKILCTPDRRGRVLPINLLSGFQPDRVETHQHP